MLYLAMRASTVPSSVRSLMAWLMSSLSLVLPWLMAMAYSSPVLICLMVWQVLNYSAVNWLATERLVTTASPLSDCKALKHSVASL